MKSTILKLFLPKPKTLANMAANSLSDFANKNQDKMIIAARYESYVKTAAAVQLQLAKWIADGKIDEVEKDEMAKALEPLFEKLYELI